MFTILVFTSPPIVHSSPFPFGRSGFLTSQPDAAIGLSSTAPTLEECILSIYGSSPNFSTLATLLTSSPQSPSASAILSSPLSSKVVSSNFPGTSLPPLVR